MRRHGAGAAEVGHVHAAGHHHRRNTGAGRGQAALGAGVEHAAAHRIRQLGGGDVQAADDVAVADQAFHGAAPAAGGMEYQHLVAGGFQDAARMLDRGGGVAEHRRRQQRPFIAAGGLRGAAVAYHAGDGAGGVGVDGAADAIHARHVHHRRHEGDVLGAGERAHVAAAHRGHHHFRHPDRQLAHGAGGQRGSAAAAHADDAVQAALAVQAAHHRGEPARHGGHRRVLVPARREVRQVAAAGRAHLRARHVRRKGRCSHHPEIDHQGGDPGPLDQFLDEREVRPLGVQRPDQHYRIGHQFLPPLPNPKSRRPASTPNLPEPRYGGSWPIRVMMRAT